MTVADSEHGVLKWYNKLEYNTIGMADCVLTTGLKLH